MVSQLWKIAKIILVLLLLFWFSFFLAHKIDLATADLGRHIINGQVLLHGSFSDKLAVLRTNFYSYTQSDFPFVNHHWGSGVVFFVLYSISGFAGLSVFYVLIGAATLLLYFWLALKRSNWLLATALALLLVPLMASRAEVRPEMFTYLFSGVFFWLISEFVRQDSTSPNLSFVRRGMYFLPVLMLIWVNLHIGFIFGIFILGAFGVLELIKDLTCLPARQGLKIKDKSSNFFDGKFWHLFKIGLLCAAAAIVNPAGLRGALYPFVIFRNYGYMIVENQSIRFLEKWGMTANMNFGLYKIVLGLAVVSLVVAVIVNWKKIQAAENLIILALGLLGFMGLRHFPSFAFIALPVVAGNLQIIWAQGSKVIKRGFSISQAIIIPLAGFAVLASLWQGSSQLLSLRPVLGWGLLPGENQSAEFFKANHLQGPIFNNYDIGGYLIFNTLIARGSGTAAADPHADQTVFVDNRPEAYPKEFFENVYKAAQTDEQVWLKLDKQYQFETIYFSPRDYTPWGQQFLIARVKDPSWAVVYYDPYSIIFLKRDQRNEAVIKRFEIPKSVFNVGQS
jgi:hypothetical protein